jgi:hypothetical protein
MLQTGAYSAISAEQLAKVNYKAVFSSKNMPKIICAAAANDLLKLFPALLFFL